MDSETQVKKSSGHFQTLQPRELAPSCRVMTIAPSGLGGIPWSFGFRGSSFFSKLVSGLILAMLKALRNL
jgi:hypothetical protein